MTIKDARKLAGRMQQSLSDELRIPNMNQFFAESADKNIIEKRILDMEKWYKHSVT
ncbi:MAG: hypothetical protein IJT41_00035 [Clostridia bacterium]|nr:hypothetical protein [Clostridia bacterium]